MDGWMYEDHIPKEHLGIAVTGFQRIRWPSFCPTNSVKGM